MPSTQETFQPPKPPPGFGFYLLFGTVIVVCLQALIYLLVLGNTLGPFSLFHREQIPNPALTRELKVALLRSEASARMFPDDPEIYFAHERYWEHLLRREGIPFRVVSDAQLAQGLGDAAVLVLPDAVCLGEAQERVIRDSLVAGKGIVGSGALATRNENCVWRGWDFLGRLAGIRNPSSLAPTSAIFVSFAGQEFFSQQVPTGYRLEIPSQEITLVSVDRPDAFWSDWMLRPAQGNSLSNVALAVHGEHGLGRFVWWGFGEELPVERVIDQRTLDHYLSSAVRWAGKQPLVILGNWPKSYQAAVLVMQNTGEDYDNAIGSASLLTQEGIPEVFFCDAADAKKNPAGVKIFRSEGEVASAGDTLEPFGGQLPLRQADRLRQAKQDLQKIMGGEVLGFAPPQGITDTGTAVALNDAGYRYYLNKMDVTRAVPEIVEFTSSVFFPFQKNEVMKVFQPCPNDFEVIANYHESGISGPDLAASFLSDFHRIYELGGAYTFYFHSYLLGSPEFRGVLREVVEAIKAQPVWITTGGSLVDWWLARHKVQVQAAKLGAHRIRLDVANMGESAVEGASVYLYLPYRPQKVDIKSAIFRLRLPRKELLDHDDLLRIDFPGLSAQTDYSYIVALDE